MKPTRDVARSGVPFLNLDQQHRELADEILARWREIVLRAGFIGGPELDEFERRFAEFCGADHAVGVSNGTDALVLALKALGVGPGDEVITAPNTFIATVEAISRAGATPVLADVERTTGTLDPARVELAIGPRTRVLMPVHLFGQTADIDPLTELARRHRLEIVEDAAQAHGARYRDRPAGSLGRAAGFSFYPGKNLGACGDGGAVTTGDADLASTVRMLRDHGQARKHHHELQGFNARLDTLQAAALTIKLARLEQWNESRRRAAGWYREHLADTGLELPHEADGRRHVYHLYVVRHPERDRLREGLTAAGIGVSMHYPTPVHLQPAYAHLGLAAGAFPEAERWAAEGLSLPIFPGMGEDQVVQVADAVRDCLGSV